MKSAFSRSRPEGCLSDLRLDQLLARELDAELERSTRAHLEGCAACAARLAAIEAERAAFLAAPPPLRRPTKGAAPAKAARRRGLVYLFPGVAAAVAAAAAVVFLLRVPPKPPSESDADPGTRIKGGSRIGFYVKRGAAVAHGGPGEVVYPGDALQFTYSTQRASYLALVSVDGAGKASLYFPESAEAAPIEPGQDVALPISTVLDDTLGGETVVGLFCAAPIPLEPLRAAFEANAAAPPLPAGCQSSRISFVKKAKP
jgi:hypothetical protein